MNEIFVTATFSGEYGWWNERLASDRAFVTALKHLAKANLLAEEAILRGAARRDVHPERVVGVLPSPPTRPRRRAPRAQPQALPLARPLLRPRRARRDVRVPDGQRHDPRGIPLVPGPGQAPAALLRHGQRLLRHQRAPGAATTGPCRAPARSSATTSSRASTYERYHLPVMHTETNLGDAEQAPGWLWKEWANMVRLKDDGVPIHRLHLVQPDRPGGLGHRAARAERPRQPAGPLRPRPQDPAGGRGLPHAGAAVARHPAHREHLPAPHRARGVPGRRSVDVLGWGRVEAAVDGTAPSGPLMCAELVLSSRLGQLVVATAPSRSRLCVRLARSRDRKGASLITREEGRRTPAPIEHQALADAVGQASACPCDFFTASEGAVRAPEINAPLARFPSSVRPTSSKTRSSGTSS